MPRKLTQEELIRRFHERWGDLYDYSNVKYVNKRTKVLVGCRTHGSFSILPLSHVQGCGCKKCGNISQATKMSKPKKDKTWLLHRLYEIYGNDKFDFSLIEDSSFEYKGTAYPLPVICKTCGAYSNVKAAQRLKGAGCDVCRKKIFSKSNLGKTKPMSELTLVSGVGIIDVNAEYRQSSIFRIWREMIARCYNLSYQRKRHTYSGCVVCEEWKCYSKYLEWYKEHCIQGFEVDKDLLSFSKGRKIYSPDTCCFLPPEINSILSRKSAKRDLPLGVHIVGGCITASCNGTHLGTFKTIEDARMAYVQRKRASITELANKWKHKLEKRAYDALINLDIDNFFRN